MSTTAFTFFADRKVYSGPTVTGSYSVRFETGNWQKENMLLVAALPDEHKMYKVTVEVVDLKDAKGVGPIEMSPDDFKEVEV